jgi:hypothetical protein
MWRSHLPLAIAHLEKASGNSIDFSIRRLTEEEYMFLAVRIVNHVNQD